MKDVEKLYYATMTKNPITIALSSINAPHTVELSAQDVVDCILDYEKAKMWPGHMASFFGDLSPDIQIAFSKAFGLDDAIVSASADAFAAWSGQDFVLAA